MAGALGVVLIAVTGCAASKPAAVAPSDSYSIQPLPSSTYRPPTAYDDRFISALNGSGYSNEYDFSDPDSLVKLAKLSCGELTAGMASDRVASELDAAYGGDAAALFVIEAVLFYCPENSDK